MLIEAKINDWITVNPFTKVRPGELINTADEQPRETILTYEEEQRLLKECDGEDRRHLRALVIAGPWSDEGLPESLRLARSRISAQLLSTAYLSPNGRNQKVIL